MLLGLATRGFQVPVAHFDGSTFMPARFMPDSTLTYSAIASKFKDGSIYSAPPEELQECLHILATHRIPNDSVQHLAVIRALTITHVQTAHVIRDLNEQNRKTQWLVIVLALASLLATADG